MDASDTGTAPNVGLLVRELRQSRKISARSLAVLINRSPAFVSQMERGFAVASVKDIYAIAAVLDVPVSYFLQDVQSGVENERDRLIRKANRRVIHENGVTTSFLSPRMRNGIEFTETVVAPLASTKRTKFNRKGFETGVLISGTVDMTFSGETFSLQAGDSYCLKLDEPHSSKNTSPTEDAVIIWTFTSFEE